MTRMKNVNLVAVIGAVVGLLDSEVKADPPVIESLSGNGELICSGLEPGSVATVEWAPTVNGPWTNSWAGLEAVLVDPDGTIRVKVPYAATMCHLPRDTTRLTTRQGTWFVRHTPVPWGLLRPMGTGSTTWLGTCRSCAGTGTGPTKVPRRLTRLVRYFKAQVEDWCDECRRLSAWEQRHLIEAPAPKQLAEHTRLLDELEHVGHWLACVTQSPDFPDRATAELVSMTVQDVKDRRALWHGRMSREQRESVLRDIFHEP